MNVLHSSKSDEWYTPPHIIERVRNVFGGTIDFDPATCEAADKIVRAETSLTGCGLDIEWWGPWFCNPPYSKAAGGCGAWIQQGINSEVPGIMLVNATTDRSWFRLIWDNADLICFLYKRLKFWREVDGELKPGDSPTHGSCLVLFNAKYEMQLGFLNQFRDIGYIVEPR